MEPRKVPIKMNQKDINMQSSYAVYFYHENTHTSIPEWENYGISIAAINPSQMF